MNLDLILLKDEEAKLKSQVCSTSGFHQVVPDLTTGGFNKHETLRALLKGSEGGGLGDEATQASFSLPELPHWLQ